MNKKSILRLLLLLVATLFIGQLWFYGRRARERDHIFQELKHQSSMVHMPPGTKVSNVYEKKGPGKVLIGSQFLSTADYSMLRHYYDQQLAANGWRIKSEKNVLDWERDLGGRITIYCKDSTIATLQYAGPQARYGWTYALDFSWSIPEPHCG
jgi:hypothetical protein